MEIIKIKISLDDYISKEVNNWGELEVKSFKLNIFMKQKYDDMGVFSDLNFIPKSKSVPNYQILRNKLGQLGINFNFLNGGTFNIPSNQSKINERNPNKIHEDYFIDGGQISGLTEDRLDVVKSYDRDLTYKPLFDVDKGLYLNYKGQQIEGVTRVNENINNQSPLTYSEDADANDINIGTINQNNGIYFKTYENIIRRVFNQDLTFNDINKTEFYFNSEGFNETNTLLEANFKEEYLFGIINTPEVENDVFIDRGRTTVLQNHLQFSEITNMGELINYGNGYYNIIK